MSIIEYLNNVNIRNTTPFHFRSTGNSFYLLNGAEIAPDDFLKRFPVEGEIRIHTDGRYKGEQVDSRCNFY